MLPYRKLRAWNDRGFSAGCGRYPFGEAAGFAASPGLGGAASPPGSSGSGGTAIVSPLTAFVSENVGNFLVGQCFVPWLHHCRPEFLAFDGDWTLQPLEHNHSRPLRTAGCKFRTSQRRILTA